MANVRSEDVPGLKVDKCISDTLMKTGGGLTLGIIFSVVVFKRKSWPVVFGLGAGTGMGYSNCQQLFDQPFLVKPDKVVVTPKAPSTTENQ